MLGHRLFARLSRHSTDWRHIGTVEYVEHTAWEHLKTLRVALRDGAVEFLRNIDGLEPTLAGHQLLRIDAELAAESPYFRLEPSDHFCLDLPMGPGVGDFHDRETQVIDLSDAPGR